MNLPPLIDLPEGDPLTCFIEDWVAHCGMPACSVCLGPSDLISIFWPNESFARRIGQPEGKMRVVVYGICHVCRELPDRAQRVEREILRDFQTQ